MDEAPRRAPALYWASPEADFLYWSKVGLWSAEESIALLLGKSPDGVNWRAVQSFVSISDFAKEFERLRQLVLHSEAMGRGQRPMQPAVVLAWADGAGLAVPDGLRTAVQARLDKKLRVALARDGHPPPPPAVPGTLPAAAAMPAQPAAFAQPGTAREAARVDAPVEPVAASAEAFAVASAAQQRQDRLRRRREALQAQGVRDITRQLAIEEGISAKRVRSILRRA